MIQGLVFLKLSMDDSYSLPEWIATIFSHLLFHPKWTKPSAPASNAILFVCISGSLFMLLIQLGISFPLLALYLNLHHSFKTNWNPTTVFTTSLNHNDAATLIILEAFVTFMKVTLWQLITLFALCFFYTLLPVFQAPGEKTNCSYIRFSSPSPSHLQQY